MTVPVGVAEAPESVAVSRMLTGSATEALSGIVVLVEPLFMTVVIVGEYLLTIIVSAGQELLAVLLLASPE